MGFQSDSRAAVIKNIAANINIAYQQAVISITLNPEQVNASGTRYTLSNGTRITIKGGLPDGRWNQTFARLSNLNNVVLSSTNQCFETVNWCARVKGQTWFERRGLSVAGNGKGFVIYPPNTHINDLKCYTYYLNPNTTGNTDNSTPIQTGISTDDC